MLFVQVTSAQDMDPSYVESEVVIPIEGAIGTIGGVEQIESLIDSRQSSIKIDFKSNINFKITALKLQEKINEIASSLPEGFTVQVPVSYTHINKRKMEMQQIEYNYEKSNISYSLQLSLIHI